MSTSSFKDYVPSICRSCPSRVDANTCDGVPDYNGWFYHPKVKRDLRRRPKCGDVASDFSCPYRKDGPIGDAISERARSLGLY